MKGFYIYCVRGKGNAEKIFAKDGKARGIEFGSKLFSIPFKDIEAVVSEVDLSKFNAKTIEEKLREDAKWTEENVKQYHEVIAKANKAGVVIPMKFGTVYKTKENLEAMLATNYGKFKKLLARLEGKQEWGVKGYLEYKRFAGILKTKDKKMQKFEKRRSSLPEGMKWYMDRKSDGLIEERIEYKVEEELQKIISKLEKLAEDVRFNDFLPKELSEPGKDMILNVACFVRNDALGEFKNLMQNLADECGALGITFVFTGPWPPYNFVDIKNE